ncbi:MAG: hypothetical protein M3220_16695 [Chloroflexota bacterium]|nr:hypothetical protein [Chloroflexota bacterium]
MTRTTVHIINHTHWDREWFLTSVYTSQWIARLTDKIDQLAANNPDYKFLLDGQTLVIEDLLKVRPEYEARINRLVKDGHLIIGPYYCQPDWQLTGGEALIRNLLYGWQDMQKHGGTNEVGWLVDTFGHIAQSPQLHQLFGLKAVYVWRGVPQMVPYFNWRGSDGHCLFTINLFGGYRNLYGVTHVPEVAIKRLQAEVAKLQPYYQTPDIPLFDGYDLEEDPEDPVSFYLQELSPLPPALKLEESPPQEFARRIRDELDNLPTIAGELNSGKYGATFPGTFSARTYLKIMNRDCEQWLYLLGEPLAVLARLKGRPYNAEQYESWARTLLQNAVHDCICGVSIDQVHEKMEFNYRAVWKAIKEDVQTSLSYILRDFAPDTYAVSTNPFPYHEWHICHDRLCDVQTRGIGVWPIRGTRPIEQPKKPVDGFVWYNDHYSAAVHSDGRVQVGEAILGQLVVADEHGDTYSGETGRRRALCRADGPLILEQESEIHCVLRYECDLAWKEIHISATVRMVFDQTPLIRWQVDLDSQGTNFRVDIDFHTAQSGQVYAGMPFDVVQRPTVDMDLLPRELERGLANVLLGQRELEAVRSFPFHDFVALSDGVSSIVILSKGLHAYQADDDGTISLTLRRAVEWLTAANLEHRVGDAGPFFYVPDARCERKVSHELGVLVGDGSVDDMAIHRLNVGFQNPPLIVEARGDGEQTEWPFLQVNLPLSSLHLYDDKLLARFFNPTMKEHRLARPYLRTDVWGHREAAVITIPPKAIVTMEIEQPLPPIDHVAVDHVITSLEGPPWRVGDNHGLPDPRIIERLREKIAQLEGRLEQIEEQLTRATGNERYFLQHRYYVIKRELYEYRLSVRLNELKLAMQGELSEAYLFTSDEQVAELGLQLNQLRIKRRIYDYIVEAV